jgi:hypothetical protein
MEMLYCPGCACHLCDSRAACPVCGAPRTGSPAAAGIAVPLRNPFKLIALCVVYAVALWFCSMFLLGFVAGARGQQLGQTLSGPLLLASIGLAIVLTVRGKLPGTAQAAPPSP